MRLIDGDELEKELEKMIADYEKRMPDWSSNDYLTSGKDAAYKWGRRADGVDDALEMVKYAPTIEAKPVKHGRWITHDQYQYKCSECETIFRSESQHIKRRGEFLWDIEEPRFCPRCGARMDGDNDD